jgi:Zn-dependent protease with chaperone function
MRRLLGGIAVGLLTGATVVLAMLPAPARAEKSLPKATSPTPETSRDLPVVTVTPAMVRYSHTRYALYFVGVAVNALALWWLLQSGISARLRDFAERKAKNGLLRAYLYYALFALLYALLTLPLAFYSSFVLPHQYGLSTNTLPRWLGDRAKGLAVTAAMMPPLVALGLWLVHRSPRRWWLAFWFASVPITFASVYLSPLVFDPLFNKYEPLKDAHLRDRLLALAARAGIERGRVYQMDASRRTRALNGYVTGLGDSARIVLWDTMLTGMSEDEIAFVMAHEMGHYLERHVLIGVSATLLGTLGLLILTDRGARWLLTRKGEDWGVRSLDDLAVVPLILLILLGLNFVGNPVEGAISRTIERRADDFGLRLTGDGRAAARSFVKLSEGNLSVPRPPAFIQFWLGSHPSLQERIDNALAWDAVHPRPLPVPMTPKKPVLP